LIHPALTYPYHISINLSVYIATIYFLFNKENTKDPFQWTIFIFATSLFATATMMTGAGIKMDQIILIDLFFNGVYITMNFIADSL
jgi:hypothetical protein